MASLGIGLPIKWISTVAELRSHRTGGRVLVDARRRAVGRVVGQMVEHHRRDAAGCERYLTGRVGSVRDPWVSPHPVATSIMPTTIDVATCFVPARMVRSPGCPLPSTVSRPVPWARWRSVRQGVPISGDEATKRQ